MLDQGMVCKPLPFPEIMTEGTVLAFFGVRELYHGAQFRIRFGDVPDTGPDPAGWNDFPYERHYLSGINVYKMQKYNFKPWPYLIFPYFCRPINHNSFNHG